MSLMSRMVECFHVGSEEEECSRSMFQTFNSLKTWNYGKKINKIKHVADLRGSLYLIFH